MNTANNQPIYANPNQGEKEKYEPLRLETKVPDAFNPTFETRMITTQDLCKKIGGLFKNAVADYFGSTLLPNPTTGQLELCIFLKDAGASDKIKMIEPVVNMQGARNNDMGSRIANLNSRNLGRTIQLTKDAQEIFEEFLLKPNYNSNKINWNNYAVECAEQVAAYGGRYNIYIKISNLNLSSVLAKIWGEKADEGGRYDYQVLLVKPIPGTNNFITTVQRFHNNNIEEFASQVGLTPTVGSFNIIQ